jgi:uncharacterized protein
MLDKLASLLRRIFAGNLSAVALIVAAMTLPAANMAQAQTEIEDRNKAAIQSGFDAWRDGTGSPFDLLADDASWTIEGASLMSKTYPTREALMSELLRPFNARMQAPLKPTVRNIYADGDTVVALFDASGTARDGKPYANTYAWFLEMRAGKIVRVSAFFDSVAFNEFWTRVSPAL